MSLTTLIAELLDLIPGVLAPIARRLPPHVSQDDLRSAGKEALIRAVGEYAGDPEGLRPYCAVRIRGAILDELRRRDPLSRHFRAKSRVLRSAVALLEVAHGRAPTDTEVAAATGFPPREIEELRALAQAALPLDSPLAAAAEDAAAASPAAAAEAEDMLLRLRSLVSALPPPQAQILRLAYAEDLSCEAIGRALGLSGERIRQLKAHAEARLLMQLMAL